MACMATNGRGSLEFIDDATADGSSKMKLKKKQQIKVTPVFRQSLTKKDFHATTKTSSYFTIILVHM